MDIRCWGSRGSIPVSGMEYVQYGGDATCIEIRTRDNQIIVVDAGTGTRRLGNQLLEEGRFAYDIIFPHAHWDHLMGFPLNQDRADDAMDQIVDVCREIAEKRGAKLNCFAVGAGMAFSL